MKFPNLRTGFFSICMCLFATTAFAEEIVMVCTLYSDGQTHTRYLKYSNPFIGSKQIYNRVDGKWEKWCRPEEPSYHEPCKLTITNLGAVMKTVQEYTATQDYPKDDLHMGASFLRHEKYILDFEFSTRRMEWYEAHMDGRPFSFGPTLENPAIQNWGCKLK